MISKNSGNVAGASKITNTLLWQFLKTNKFKKNIYYLLLYSTIFQDHFKIGMALPQLQKNYQISDQIQDGQTPLSVLKKAGLRYGATKIYLGQCEVPVQR